MNIEQVYDIIAPKFDHTRYSVWSSVKSVLDTYDIDSNNIDMGCGNGKNMLYRKDINFTGIDISQSFVDICRDKHLICYKSDIRKTIFDDNNFDNSISIAVIHHLDSVKKRVDAINEMFRITKVNGTLFIYVWAYNQPKNSKRQFTSYDEMVPFEYNNNKYYRYYHLYQEDEILNEVKLSDYQFKVINKGYEMGNYFIHLTKV